ncbi:MerR family transcriptional regulator [Erythrobacter sp. HL-111]|uniref:MerR family transcriptional regulator n=1 Tax=Erythrobacter sp. HL-111 TaxID=1798193 RepID=UPI0006DA19F2|nr:MerR family transcriptional regulator [Erythrobacter sp. HL-111]KPP86212.1 MAG: putative transcriptional regulator [Erythrobacteraceae bacterium HL-111]SDS21461.1 DNA-binding transcriptional regulator, MerR family [Erythrobacter sp. HL-111]
MAEFEDGKDEGALRTIGEVSEALGIKPHVLRYWEQQFSLLKPLKRSGGRRYYRQSDVALVETIDRLVNQEGYTLKGAEAVLRASAKSEHDRRRGGDRRSGDRRAGAEQGDGEARASAAEDARRLAETLAGLKRVRARLARALEA